MDTLPGIPPPLPRHICGPADHATQPSRLHYAWHLYHQTPFCDKSRKERAWHYYEKDHGPTPNYQWTPHPPANYICGPAEDATGPSGGHYMWHLKPDTPPPCGKASRENAWRAREHYLGHPIENYNPHHPVFICGDADEATESDRLHYDWHRRPNNPPMCEKALTEVAWLGMEQNLGYALSEYTPRDRWDWNHPTHIYCYRFVDGDMYFGITMHRPEARWRSEMRESSRLGVKLRSGAMFVTEVLYTAPNRQWALVMEKAAIRVGNPCGDLLNVAHNAQS